MSVLVDENTRLAVAFSKTGSKSIQSSASPSVTTRVSMVGCSSGSLSPNSSS